MLLVQWGVRADTDSVQGDARNYLRLVLGQDTLNFGRDLDPRRGQRAAITKTLFEKVITSKMSLLFKLLGTYSHG